jgi:hypothetical protein
MKGEGALMGAGGGVIGSGHVGICAVGGRGLRVIVLDEVLWIDAVRSWSLVVLSTGVGGGVCLVSCVNVVVSTCLSMRGAVKTSFCCTLRSGWSSCEGGTDVEGTTSHDARDIEGDGATELVPHSALSSFSL